MTALAPASRTRAPEPHQHRPHAPGHPRIHSQMRLSDAPARGFHQAQPAQCCRPRPVLSHLPHEDLLQQRFYNSNRSTPTTLVERNHFAFQLLLQLIDRSSSFRFVRSKTFSSVSMEHKHQYGIQTGFTNTRSSRLDRWRHSGHTRAAGSR